MTNTTTLTGELVVAANPGIRIRSTRDYMGAMTEITAARCAADGSDIDLEFGGAFKNFYEDTVTLTADGLRLYEDESANLYTEDLVAVLLPDGTLVPLKAERIAPVFLGDVEWAKRLIVAAQAALPGVAEGDLHNNLLTAINEAVLAVWRVQAPAPSTRNDATHRFEVRAKATRANIGWFPVERYGREAARAHAIALLTQSGAGYEIVERGRPDVDPGEFWRCAEAGYTVTEYVAPLPGGGPEVNHFDACGPDGEELCQGFYWANERVAWEACDRHRMFGSAAPLED